MTRFAIVFLAGIAGIFAAAGAQACRIRRPEAVPLAANVDAVALTTVVGADDHGADLRIDEVLDGALARANVHVEYGGRPGPGGIVVTSCGPPGPPVHPGERVVLVYGRSTGERYLIGWTTLEYALRADDFFALYQAAQTEPARRRLLARWRQVNRYQGPVPLTDPEHWMPPHVGGLGWGGQDDLAYVSFHVADDGRIAECFALQGVSNPRSDAICARIRDRRFLPPMFARERDGKFRVRWNGDPPG
jgi:hypothetical protein